MKLAIVRQHYRPDGGAERFVSRALEALSKVKTLTTTVITRQWDDTHHSDYQVILCNPKITGRIQREQAFAEQAKTYFGQFDLVQSHERIPGCHIYRAGDGVHRTWLSERSRILNPIKRYFLWHSRYHRYVMAQEAAMYADPNLKAVICNARMIAGEIMQTFHVPPEKIHVIYNGVNTEDFSPALKQQHRAGVRQALAIPPEAPVMLFVGSGFERKGLAGAIHAIAQHAEVHLIVVGKDKKTSSYKRLAYKTGASNRVHFVGMQKDPRPYYGAADMLLLPTLYDPFPNVVLEAMASGLGVITSTKCGGQEFIRENENGFVCDALDYTALSDAVARAQECGFETMGNTARETVLPYNLTALSDNMLSLYQSLL